jgi:hypothetical protein
MIGETAAQRGWLSTTSPGWIGFFLLSDASIRSVPTHERTRRPSTFLRHLRHCVITSGPSQAQKYRAPTLLRHPVRCQTTSERADHQYSCVICVICVIAIEANPPAAVGRTYDQ